MKLGYIKAMDIKDIYSKLCYYDIRNPYGANDEEVINDYNKKKKAGDECFCDNCFYGRTELALELLKYAGNEKRSNE